MGIMIYREANNSVYQFGGFESDGYNFQLDLNKKDDWHEFVRN